MSDIKIMSTTGSNDMERSVTIKAKQGGHL